MNFSDAVLAKARKLINTDKMKRDDTHRNVWWVSSARGDKTYRVQSDLNPETGRLSWLTCTCPHGLNTGAGTTHCYHAAAVLLMHRQEMDENGGDEEMDRDG